jgi:hypothetical protein
VNPRSRLHLSLLVIVLINALPAVQAEDSWGLLAILVGAAVVSCIAYRRSGEPRCPRWVIYIGVLSSVAFLIREMLGAGEEPTVYVLDLAHFLILLCCCKFFEIRAGRDLGVIAVVAFLLLAISGLVSASLFFGLALAVDLTAGAAWVMEFQRRRDEEALSLRRLNLRLPAAAWATPPAGSSASSQGPQSPVGGGRSWTWSMVRCSFALSVICVGVFVGVPRGWGRGLFGGFHRIVPTSLAGVSDQVQLRDTKIVEDLTPVLRARFSLAGRPITDEDFHPYLRGLTYDRYHGGRWQRTPTVAEALLPAGSLQNPTPLVGIVIDPGSGRIVEQEIWLDEVRDGALFVMFPPVALGSSDTESVSLDRRDLALTVRRPGGGSLHYLARSLRPEAGPATISMGIRPGMPRDGPSSIPPAVARLGRDLATRYGDPSDPAAHAHLAGKIRDFLRSGEFEYTLDRSPTARKEAGVDPIEDFLLQNRRGHCEYFASAMALLCQSAGIRARLVTGYFAGEYNEVGGYWQFRRRHSHAWVEVYIPDRGWASFDPTPAATTAVGEHQAGLQLRLRRLVEYLHFRWSLFVVSFDTASRERIFEQVRGWLAELEIGKVEKESFWAALHDLIWGPEMLSVWQRLLYWLLLVLSVTLFLLILRVLWLLSLMIRERLCTWGRRGRSLARQPEARFYDRLLLLLAAKGHVKPAHQTPREFAGSLARRHRDFGELPVYTEWFYEVQYGGRTLGGSRREGVQSFLQRLRDDSAFGAR